MRSALRWFLPFLFALSFLPASAAEAVVAWEFSITHRFEAKADTLPNGRSVLRLRYRGEAGDVVWATLRGETDDEDMPKTLKTVVLEYDASGGHGEWEPAEPGGAGSMSFEIRAPAGGLVEFRVRTKDASGARETFVLDLGADTEGAKPLCFYSSELKETLEAGYNRTTTLNVARGNSAYEFEVWSQGFSPKLSVTDPKGVTLPFTALDQGPTYVSQRYRAPSEGPYEVQVSGAPEASGNFTLRSWYSLPLERRK